MAKPGVAYKVVVSLTRTGGGGNKKIWFKMIQNWGCKVFVEVLHEDSAMVGMARVKVRRCCICSSSHALNDENTCQHGSLCMVCLSFSVVTGY